MKAQNEDIQQHLKERTICIRISAAQESVIRAAMDREGVAFLSRFVRAAILDLAERILTPVDLDAYSKAKDLEDGKARLRRALQELELERARGTSSVGWARISNVMELARQLL